MALNITGKITSGSTTADLDSKYGPYTSLSAAWDVLGPDGDDVVAIGLTIGVQATSSSPIIEYWFKDGTEFNDLVLKAQSPVVIDGGGAPTSSEFQGGLQ